MKAVDKVESKDNETSIKTTSSQESTPLIHLPKAKKEFLLLFFEEEKNTLIILFGGLENNSIKYTINDLPIEKCNLCKDNLNLNNSYYYSKDSKFYCNNCINTKNEFKKLIISTENTFEENELIKKLKKYTEKNANKDNNKYADLLNDLIKLTKYFLYYLDIFQKLSNEFESTINIINNYIENLSFYFDEIMKINMNYLYLFVRNIFIPCLNDYDKLWFIKEFTIYFKSTNFNIFYLRELILKRTIRNTFHIEIKKKKEYYSLYQDLVLNEIISNFFNKYLFPKKDDDIKFYLFSKINELSSQINETYIKELISEIKAIKLEINLTISNYYNSFKLSVEKKVIERKIINILIYLILKKNHSLFIPVNESEAIINATLKELKKILSFLNNKTDKISKDLINKIIKEISYIEKKKIENSIIKDKKLNSIIKNYKRGNILLATEIISSSNIQISDNEKKILSNFLIEYTDNESFSSIKVNKNISNTIIEPNKLEVIIEFLFFMRDKTIDIIHILNSNSSFFFSLLNHEEISDNDDNEKIKNNQIIIKNDKINDENEEEEDDYLDENLNELKQEIIYDTAKKAKNQNKKIFEKIKIKEIEEVKCKNAIDYVFYQKEEFDCKKEVDYLYKNIIMPKSNKEKILYDPFFLRLKQTNRLKKIPKLEKIKNDIKSAYSQLDNNFKEDPFYNNFQEYFQDLEKQFKEDEIFVTKRIIQFYNDYVEGFKEYEELYSFIKLIENDEKLNELKQKKIEKLISINEKYKYIKEKLEDILVNNKEEYSKYYDEFLTKNNHLIIEGYNINLLINDIKKIVPLEENIQIIGRDKSNFLFMLFLFQSNYFLKNYV